MKSMYLTQRGNLEKRENSPWPGQTATTDPVELALQIDIGQAPPWRCHESSHPPITVDLERYIPLGSLTYEPIGLSDVPLDVENWCEVHAERLSFPKSELFDQLAHLCASGWVRLFVGKNLRDSRYVTARVYLLPDDVARGWFPRTNRRCRSCLRTIMGLIDGSVEGWLAKKLPEDSRSIYEAQCDEEDSLFYIFNTLESPRPSYEAVKDEYIMDAMEDILETSLSDRGLKTNLYPYQRRSAAVMLQRESNPALRLDPRLETFKSPTSRTFYFDRDTCHVLSESRSYNEARGGILGETMGLGKTIICLAVILATKDHCPEIPPEHSTNFDNYKNPEGCRSLALMAADAIRRNNAPWRLHFRELRRQGEHLDNCTKLLEEALGGYWIHTPQVGRRELMPKRQKIYLAPTTLVVVPPNLFSQWQKEISLHLEADALKILIVREQDNFLPLGHLLARYDMILMTRTRFEEETNGKAGRYESDDKVGCLCQEVPRRCRVHVYKSPLLDVHFLRFIVDEGHGFISSGSRTQASKGLSSIQVERKWIVSGTPAGGLVGVEVDLAAEENGTNATSEDDTMTTSHVSQTVMLPNGTGVEKLPSQVRRNRRRSEANTALQDKRQVSTLDQERKDIEKLGHIVKSFLGVQPWSNSQTQDVANWNTYVMPSSTGTRKPLSLRSVLQGLVVRHRLEDVEMDLQLPPLYNKTVRLQPCFFDKLSVNLFLLVLTNNAVTSERTDQDYMFHPRNRSSLEALIKNLRHSGFFWTGFTAHDISESCRVGREYLENPEHLVTAEDRSCLEAAMDIGQAALLSPAWNSMGIKHEIGMYVDNFPPDAADAWALGEETPRSPLLLGATQLEAAKNLVEANLFATHPFACLNKNISSDPASSLENQISNKINEFPKKKKAQVENAPSGKGVPKSSLQDPLRLTNSQFSRRQNARKVGLASLSVRPHPPSLEAIRSSEVKSVLKEWPSKPDIPQSYEQLKRTQLVGTASAKLSYLIDKIVDLQKEEKILVFYEGDDIAYYCAQTLEILGIPYLIYASGISIKLRTEYQSLFNDDKTFRVMLMDLRQAAHGLHIASASRVFFVNPVWQPNIEAQAIKRAHRIGQTRPVYVETLVLAGSLEEEMLQRRKTMSSEEHHKAAKSLLDDLAINEIIKKAQPIPLTDEELSDAMKQHAALQSTQQVFARCIVAAYGSPEAVASACRQAAAKNSPERPASPRKRKAMFADDVDHDNNWINHVAASHTSIASDTDSEGIHKRAVRFADEGGSPKEATSAAAEPARTAIQPKRRRATFADKFDRFVAKSFPLDSK